MANIQVTPEELRTLQTHCGTAAGDVLSLQQRVQSQIESTNWHSPAADRFRGDWTGTYVPALTRLQEALRDLGQAAATMATNYDNTEASYQSSGS
jgi:WXG100 family type VII secretion target